MVTAAHMYLHIDNVVEHYARRDLRMTISVQTAHVRNCFPQAQPHKLKTRSVFREPIPEVDLYDYQR
jgi:hypothetical protein